MEAVLVFFGVALFAMIVLAVLVPMWTVLASTDRRTEPAHGAREGAPVLRVLPPLQRSDEGRVNRPTEKRELVERLERRVRSERMVAAQFAAEPSFANLHRECPRAREAN